MATYWSQRIRLITATDLDLALVKSQLRVQHTHDDALIAHYMAAAKQWVENRCRTSIDLAYYRVSMPAWCGHRDLVGPTRGIVRVTYYDSLNTLQEIASADTTIVLDQHRGHVDIRNATLPATYCRDEAVIIDYVAGYGVYDENSPGYDFSYGGAYGIDAHPMADTLPNDMIQAMLMLITHWYEDREAVVVGVASQSIPFGVESLLQGYINPRAA